MPQASLTRRDFLRALVPAWLTVRAFTFATLGIAALFIVSAMVSEAKSERLWANLRGLGIVCAAGLLLWLVARLVAAIASRSRQFPPAIAALVTVLGRLVTMAATAAFGAYLYVRWQNGDDLLGVAISLGVFALAHFRDEWARRSKNQPPAFDSAGTPH